MSSFRSTLSSGSATTTTVKFSAGTRVPIAFAAVFGLMGLGFMSIGGTMLFLQHYRLATYQPVSARVVSSQLTSYHDRHGTHHSAAISYVYSVNGQTYQASRVYPLGSASGSATAPWRIVSNYAPGTITTAWFNLSDPNSAFLIRQAFWFPYLLCVFPAVFVAVSLILIISSLHAGRAVAPPVPDGSGWFAIPEEGTLRGRFKAMAVGLIFWLIIGCAAAADWFFDSGKQLNPFFWILIAITAGVGFLLLWLLWRRWQLCHDFLDAEIRIPVAQIRPGDAIQIRLRQEILSPVEIEDLSLGLICICDDRITGNRSKTQYTSYEAWSHWNKLTVHRNYAAGSHLDAQDHFRLPPNANPTTPHGQRDYPMYRWYIVMEITSTAQPRLRAKFPVKIDP